MNELQKRYKSDGIWTFESSRTSCVVPERPLIISSREERVLNALCLSAWKALDSVVSTAKNGDAIVNGAKPYFQGPTMPPAIRIDTVRTLDGPKIVEIDPVSAISIGETLSLQNIWQEQGYAVPQGLRDAIVSDINARGDYVSVDIPSGKAAYIPELDYLLRQLKDAGIDKRTAGTGDEVPLSAFTEDGPRRRQVNSRGWPGDINPLWGPLIGIADKNNLKRIISGDKITLPAFMIQQYTRDELLALDDDMGVIVKPQTGTGSMGVRRMTVAEAKNVPDGYVFQQEVLPISDDFGQTLGPEGKMYDPRTPWISRVSVYAGRYGLIGAEVTARQKSPDGFTNVHGQVDAVQTTIAIDINKGEC